VKIVGIIPARYASTRFPGKPLALIAGKPLIQHVVEQCLKAKSLSEVVVATDDERIAEVARKFSRVAMTRADHPSGSDRIAEAANKINCDAVVNIQGDEPLIDPAAIDAAILPLEHEPDVVMATLSKRIDDPREIDDPNVVKVVTDRAGDAIYFSRCPIPFDRDRTGRRTCFKHIGLYVYRRNFLLQYPSLPVGPLENAERLEQLRAIENGYPIRVVETEYDSLGVDTPQDLERVSRLFEASITSGVQSHG